MSSAVPEPKRQMLFDEIIEKCAQTDPKISIVPKFVGNFCNTIRQLSVFYACLLLQRNLAL